MANKLKRITALALALVMTAVTLSGCSSSSEDEEQMPELPENIEKSDEEIKYYAADDVFSLNCNRNESFNPFVSKNVSNLIVSQLLYDNLYDVDETYTAVPNIIKEAKSEDGKGWMLTVDTDEKFWDGSTVTAQDVNYSIRMAKGSPQYSAKLKAIMGVSALDAETVAINLYYADKQLPLLLSIPVIKDGSNDEAVPMGTGPYKINSVKTELNAVNKSADLPTDTILLKEYKAVEDILNAYSDSTIDLVTNDPNGMMNLGYGSSNEVRHYPTTSMHYLGFNSNSKYFSNPKVRRALNFVVDRQTISMDVMKGAMTPSALPINPASALYNNRYSELFTYSQKKCDTAFKRAEVDDYDEDGLREMKVSDIPVEIDIDFIVCNENAKKVDAARQIANNLTQLGITVNIRELSFEKYQSELQNGNFDMYYAETMLTPDFSLRQLLIYGKNLNFGNFADSTLEQYIDNYLSADDENRQNEADVLYKYIADNAPIVTIGFEKKQVITHNNAISGIRPTQYNIFNNLENWEFKKREGKDND